MIRNYTRWVGATLCMSLFLPLVAALCTRLILGHPVFTATLLPILLVFCVSLVGVSYLILYILRRLRPTLEAAGEAQARFLDTLRPGWVGPAIVVAAALSLYLELVVIRWQASVFTLFAFYKNVGLLSCFAGLGIGYALARARAIPLVVTVPLLAWQVLLLIFTRYNGEGLRSRSLLASPVVEQLNMEFATASGVPSFLAIYLFLTIAFLLTALAFIPVGQLCGRLMARRDNLSAYGLNLLGSLTGVLLAFGVGWFWTPPVVWFAIGFAALLPFVATTPRALVVTGTAALILCAALAWPVNTLTQKLYSPYQLVERFGEGNRMKISASGIHFQVALDLSAANPRRDKDPFLKAVRGYYELPYHLHGESNSAVIVGAGTGNDVAAAVRMGVDEVAAIEIDPVILHLGKAYHPEEPYEANGVRPIVNDARSFFRGTDETFDVVAYGFLDSHALLSHASNIRVDSYVYTIEGLREARACLNEGGILSLTFNILKPELGRKIYLMLTEAFDGTPPVCLRSTASDYGAVSFVQREGRALSVSAQVLNDLGFEDCTAVYADASLAADSSTDDWPFLYMPQRVYPFSYLGMIALVGILSALLIFSASESRPQFSHSAFFFLGAGFMLVETKGITELGLAFGNTWQVIGIVIAGILGMAFLANVVVQFTRMERTWWPFAGLVASLVVGYLIARSGGFPPTFAGKLGTLAILTVPVFFSGLLFSILIRNKGNIAGIMAANLLGAMFGGLLEYNAMYFGFSALYILAGLLYTAAMITHWRQPVTTVDG